MGEADFTFTLTVPWMPSDRELRELPLTWEVESDDVPELPFWSLAESHPLLEGGL